jgi:hypothetical protein
LDLLDFLWVWIWVSHINPSQKPNFGFRGFFLDYGFSHTNPIQKHNFFRFEPLHMFKIIKDDFMDLNKCSKSIEFLKLYRFIKSTLLENRFLEIVDFRAKLIL